MKELEEFLKIHKQHEDALSTTVKINHEQICYIVVNDLIQKRNSHGNKIVDHFDKVLRYYLDEDEFKRYVINKEPLIP